jgi:hypothetical protein
VGILAVNEMNESNRLSRVDLCIMNEMIVFVCHLQAWEESASNSEEEGCGFECG